MAHNFNLTKCNQDELNQKRKAQMAIASVFFGDPYRYPLKPPRINALSEGYDAPISILDESNRRFVGLAISDKSQIHKCADKMGIEAALENYIRKFGYLNVDHIANRIGVIESFQSCATTCEGYRHNGYAIVGKVWDYDMWERLKNGWYHGLSTTFIRSPILVFQEISLVRKPYYLYGEEVD
jgi:hypothetical protein